jgi:hypothetical protein
MTKSPLSSNHSTFIKLQLDYDAQCVELEQLRAALSDRDSIISKLKQNEDNFPTSRLSSEISLFAQFAESTARRLTDAQIVSHHERRNLEASAQRFATISSLDHPKLKVTQFFDEVQNFCQLLTEKALRTNSHEASEIPSASVLLHESEIHKLRIQHQLYRVQRQLDESSADNHNLSEQIKNEHYLMLSSQQKHFRMFLFMKMGNLYAGKFDDLILYLKIIVEQLVNFEQKLHKHNLFWLNFQVKMN